MPLLLCHECYTWTEPVHERCPLCQQPLDADLPDPPLSVLQQEIGEVRQRLGQVRVRRKMLPGLGTFYATSRGLLFLPHRVEQVQPVSTTAPGGSLWWTLAAMFWSPVLLVLLLVRLLGSPNKRITVCVPEYLPPGDAVRPAEFLMQNPGVFFIPLEDLQFVTRRRRGWVLERMTGPAVQLRPESDPAEFARRLEDLLATDAWRMVMTG